MRAPRNVAQNRFGVVFGTSRRAPHRYHAAIPVGPRGLKSPPSMATDRNYAPTLVFRMGDGGFDLLAGMARSCHSMNLPVDQVLTFVNINLKRALLPLNRPRRLAGVVIDHPVDPLHFVHNPRCHP